MKRETTDLITFDEQGNYTVEHDIENRSFDLEVDNRELNNRLIRIEEKLDALLERE